MKYYTLDPPASLGPYVRSFWVLEGEATEKAPYIYRGYADGCAELLFHYDGMFDELVGDEERSSYAAGLHAQTRKFTRFIVKRNFGIFGCYLFPFAIPKLFSYAAADLTDITPDLETFLGSEGRELEERMMLAGSNAVRYAILSSYLEGRLEKNRRDIPNVSVSIRRMLDFRGTVNVRSLAREQFMSDRTFARKFKEFSGFSPKLYSRIARFQAASRENPSGISLTDIAYKYGYYDQSHFINDFREFTGYSPKKYFSGLAEGSEFLTT
jgi:AraC-like DNA-binding protein